MLNWLLRLRLLLFTILIPIHHAIAGRSEVFFSAVTSFDAVIEVGVVWRHFMVRFGVLCSTATRQQELMFLINQILLIFRVLLFCLLQSACWRVVFELFFWSLFWIYHFINLLLNLKFYWVDTPVDFHWSICLEVKIAGVFVSRFLVHYHKDLTTSSGISLQSCKSDHSVGINSSTTSSLFVCLSRLYGILRVKYCVYWQVSSVFIDVSEYLSLSCVCSICWLRTSANSTASTFESCKLNFEFLKLQETLNL